MSSFELKTYDPERMSVSKPLFSHVATASGDMKVVFIAGQVGMDEHGKVAETYEAQVEQTVKNISMALAAAGARVTDIVKMNYYIVNYHPTDRPHVPIVLKWLNGHRPTTMLVPVQQLAKPEFLFEMDATAITPKDCVADKVPRPVPVADTTPCTRGGHNENCRCGSGWWRSVWPPSRRGLPKFWTNYARAGGS